MQGLSEIHALYLIPNALYFKMNINFKNQKRVKRSSQKNNEIVLNKATS